MLNPETVKSYSIDFISLVSIVLGADKVKVKLSVISVFPILCDTVSVVVSSLVNLLSFIDIESVCSGSLMFILNEVNEDYFFRDGIPRDSAILNINCERKDWQIQKINNNNIGIINSEFAFRDCIKKNIFKWFSPLYGKDVLRNFWLLPCPRFPGIKHYHLHGNYLKTTYELLWNKFFVDLDETSFHKFREPSLDVNQWLVKDWQIVSGNFVPQAPCGIFHDMKKRNDFECLIKDIVNAKSKILCINDAEDISMEEYEYKKKRLIESFERKFPHKSSFEKGVK